MESTDFFRPAAAGEGEMIFALYRSLVGTPYCPWDATYPARENVDDDLATGTLFVLANSAGIVAAGTIRHCEEHDGLVPWTGRNPCDLMRFGVARMAQGRGVGRRFLDELAKTAGQRGFDTMRILVARDNLPAVQLYRRGGGGIPRYRLQLPDPLALL